MFDFFLYNLELLMSDLGGMFVLLISPVRILFSVIIGKMRKFELQSEFEPKGDQIKAIQELTEDLKKNQISLFW